MVNHNKILTQEKLTSTLTQFFVCFIVRIQSEADYEQRKNRSRDEEKD